LASFFKDNTVLPWSIIDGKNVTIITSDKYYSFDGTFEKDGTNFMGLIVFSILLGVILKILGEDGRALLDFCKSWYHVVMIMVSWIMW
jgi:Na+/H+-dicarboxylate symporter